MAFLIHVSVQIKIILIVIITLATLIGIMLRPWKTNEAQIALLGAFLLLILGLISVNTAFFTLLNNWNTFFFFLGMMSIAALAEEAGFFDWLAFQAAHYDQRQWQMTSSIFPLKRKSEERGGNKIEAITLTMMARGFMKKQL